MALTELQGLRVEGGRYSCSIFRMQSQQNLGWAWVAGEGQREPLGFQQVGEALEETSSTEGGGRGLGQEEKGLV